MRLSLLVLAAGLATGAAAQPAEIHCKHFFYGYPTGTPSTNDLVVRDAYALSANGATRFADWAAYRLTPHEVFGWLDLERAWRSTTCSGARWPCSPTDRTPPAATRRPSTAAGSPQGSISSGHG
jgi:hypothetical protein